MPFRAVIGLILACVVHASASGAQLAATGISVPMFDAKGKLTHKLIAKRGSMAGGLQQLHEVEIV